MRTMAKRIYHRETSLLDKIQPTESGCWEWAASRFGNGYGQFRRELAHRAMYKFLVGDIPTGLTLDHLCRNRGCVNPDHLEPVTIRVNVLRGDTIPAHQMRRTQCPQGHSYDKDNTYLWHGKRNCRACRFLQKRKAVRPSSAQQSEEA